MDIGAWERARREAAQHGRASFVHKGVAYDRIDSSKVYRRSAPRRRRPPVDQDDRPIFPKKKKKRKSPSPRRAARELDQDDRPIFPRRKKSAPRRAARELDQDDRPIFPRRKKSAARRPASPPRTPPRTPPRHSGGAGEARRLWQLALEEYNDNPDRWCVPKVGTADHRRVQAIRDRLAGRAGAPQQPAREPQHPHGFPEGGPADEDEFEDFDDSVDPGADDLGGEDVGTDVDEGSDDDDDGDDMEGGDDDQHPEMGVGMSTEDFFKQMDRRGAVREQDRDARMRHWQQRARREEPKIGPPPSQAEFRRMRQQLDRRAGVAAPAARVAKPPRRIVPTLVRPPAP